MKSAIEINREETISLIKKRMNVKKKKVPSCFNIKCKLTIDCYFISSEQEFYIQAVDEKNKYP